MNWSKKSLQASLPNIYIYYKVFLRMCLEELNNGYQDGEYYRTGMIITYDKILSAKQFGLSLSFQQSMILKAKLTY